MPLALITGPTAGIGNAFARQLAAEGYDLVLVSRETDRLTAVGRELSAVSGVRCDPLPADLSDVGDTGRVEARLREAPVDMLVNNAGFGLARAFEDNAIETEQQGLDVHVRATMRLTHAALEPMLARGSGDIINIASVAAYVPRGTYSAHKAWVTSFSSWANVYYRPRGVRVTAVCPGFVRTEFHARIDADTSGIPDWMWLDADDVAREGLRDCRAGRAVSVPGLRYKAIVGLSHVTPRRLAERLSRRGR